MIDSKDVVVVGQCGVCGEVGEIEQVMGIGGVYLQCQDRDACWGRWQARVRGEVRINMAVEPKLEQSMGRQLRALLDQGKQEGQDNARRQARLIRIIEDFNIDGCPLHGVVCSEPAKCLADEIISRALSWI